MASSQLKHWSLTLQAYEYSIKHKSGKQLANADALSRLPLSQQPQAVPVSGDINLLLQHLNNTPVTATEIKTWTDRDPLLSKVRRFVMTGWPVDDNDDDEALHSYFNMKDELSVHSGWGSHVIILPKMIVKGLHESHSGISHMKGQAREYVW